MRELFVTRAAQADMLEIWSHFFENDVRAAELIIDAITEKCDLLLEFPSIGRLRTEFGATYRSLSVENYVIFYRILDANIEISRVVHGARDMASIFAVEE